MRTDEGVFEEIHQGGLNHLQPKFSNCSRKGYFAKGLKVMAVVAGGGFEPPISRLWA